MKLLLQGHDYQYAVEQMLATLFPGEKPSYAPASPEESLIRVRLSEAGQFVTASCVYRCEKGVYSGRAAVRREKLNGPGERDRLCQVIIKNAMYRAVRASGLPRPPWGALTGVRPGKLMRAIIRRGDTGERAVSAFTREYDVTRSRAKLCYETALETEKAERLLTGQDICLYVGIPFCPTRCTYCSFVSQATKKSLQLTEPFLEALLREIHAIARQAESCGLRTVAIYMGGGTPTIMIDELTRTIRQARDAFSIREVSSETNPNHLIPEYIDKLDGVVQRLSVGVQSFDDGLLKQMDRYDKYGSAETILERVRTAADARVFTSLNVDMIFNFPAQTEAMLRHDLEVIKQSHTNQTTFYPLMASPAVEKSLAATVGEVDYAREQRFYEIICDELVGAAATGAGSGSASRDIRPLREKPAPFTFGSAWTFNASNSSMIDEYIVDYEEYPAIGSGGLTYLDRHLYVNTFSLGEYDTAIKSGRMSIMGATKFSKRDAMRYRMLMQLFGLRLDKKQWERDFGCSFAAGLPAEYAYLKSAGAFDIDDDEQVTLTAKGRYLMVAMMRQFFIGVNGVRDKARAALPEVDGEREL